MTNASSHDPVILRHSECVLIIATSSMLVSCDKQVWVHLTAANNVPLDGEIVIDVISSNDEIVESHELAREELKGSEGRKAWPVGPLPTPDRYTIRATVKGSGVFALAVVFVTMPGSDPSIDLFRDALGLRMRASRLLEEGLTTDAAEPLRKAAEIYSEIGEGPCASIAWRDLSFIFRVLNDKDNSVQTAMKSLEEGLLTQDAQTGMLFLTEITRHASQARTHSAVYRSLVYAAFMKVGPENAYIEAPRITSEMSMGERGLFAATVLDLFPIVCQGDWIYVYDRQWACVHQEAAQGNWAARIPNDDRSCGLMRYAPLQGTVASISQDLAEVV